MGHNRLRLESAAGSKQRGHAEFGDARLFVGLPRRGDVSRDIRRSFRSGVATEIKARGRAQQSSCRQSTSARPVWFRRDRPTQNHPGLQSRSSPERRSARRWAILPRERRPQPTAANGWPARLRCDRACSTADSPCHRPRIRKTAESPSATNREPYTGPVKPIERECCRGRAGRLRRRAQGHRSRPTTRHCHPPGTVSPKPGCELAGPSRLRSPA